MVREALAANPALARRALEVFGHGSYRNNTNVRLESDVDVCVRCMDVFYPDFTFAPDTTSASLGLRDSDYMPAGLKSDVDAALRVYFGAPSVEFGNKVIVVRENTYRVSVDVAPTFERRLYYMTNGELRYESGTVLHPDRGPSIDNWPQQHYDNGVAKNRQTGRRFKAVVRILKRMRDEMAQRGVHPPIGGPIIPSFLIESLVWNVSDERFNQATFIEDVRMVLADLVVATSQDGTCSEWLEVSGRKYLFRDGQGWTRDQAFAFALAAWRYVGF